MAKSTRLFMSRGIIAAIGPTKNILQKQIDSEKSREFLFHIGMGWGRKT
jgi:hypothetical protein